MNLSRWPWLALLDARHRAGERVPGENPVNTAINTDPAGERIFVGGFKDIQFVTNQRNNPPQSANLAGTLYEVVPE